MAASARPGGEKATSFAMACSLLSRLVRQNGAAAAELGLGIKGEVAPVTSKSLMPGAEGEETAERKKETMELFPQRTGFGTPDASSDAAREQEKQQLTIFYGGKVLVFDVFPTDKAKDLMQLAGKRSSPVVRSVGLPQPSAPTVVTDNTKVVPVPVPVSSTLPGGAQADDDAQKPARANVSDMPIARKASLHRFLEKRKDRLNAKMPYQTCHQEATPPVKKEQPESRQPPWLGLAPNAVKSNNNKNLMS